MKLTENLQVNLYPVGGILLGFTLDLEYKFFGIYIFTHQLFFDWWNYADEANYLRNGTL